MKKKLPVLFLLLFGALHLIEAHNPVWTKDIAPILFKHCTSCHNQSGLAPFPLISYDDAYFNRYSILSSIKNGKMPPWPPDPNYSHFVFERRLSADEIHLIEEWVGGAASYGNPIDAPTPPVFSNAPAIATPQLSLEIPEYTISSNKDVYRCFPIASGVNVDKFITAFECVPGNASVVHHVLVYADTAKTVLTLDARDPGPGYTSFGGVGSNSAVQIGAWVPGSRPTFYPKGMGQLLAKNATVILQVHYAPGSIGKKDRTRFLAKLESGPMRRLETLPLLNHLFSLTNGPLVLPANQIKTIKSQFRVPIQGTVIAVAPHMHLLGKSIKVWGITPKKDTLKVIRINNWDFHWQGSYLFPKAMVIPLGTTVYGEAVYDNTENNFDNPNTPPKEVRVGEATTDEMMLVYFTFAAYQLGDENLVLAPSEVTASRELKLDKLDLKIAPNPVRDQAQISFTLPEAEAIWIDVFDAQGRWMRSLAANQQSAAGLNQQELKLVDLASGNYFLRLRTQKGYGSAALIKL
ncbi:T9SS type A sorting domain-containing protein [Haliscomenobacter hydrossis]|uniref:Copper type II ascorbate-dependent monooxygenase n=1 Tax=Haliscomenobacter hydrossis (strain ATCC 27775 / DSM 1100 / LMG 10767 / O) TaxID=760192 RepID=F4KTF0_HALH1|nr:T9SS type A sorting domain-containing protein [Haliscomenobacter hydrossis]AEE52364.1 Copper type II ascorbate-dependent monooxygenase [Haliscomenobacter hydrossis DSM 1100]